MRAPLFILSTGRSGSTLLQRILNTYDDIAIWGEHGGFLRDTAAAWFRLIESPGSRKYVFQAESSSGLLNRQEIQLKKHPSQWQAWINFFGEDDARDYFRRHVESFFRHPAMGDDHVWGFKEIRYGVDDRVIEFLADLYPEAIFVFLSRNVYDTVASQRKAFSGQSKLAGKLPTREFRTYCRWWRDQNQCLLDWHRSGRLRSFWIKFEDLSGGLATLEPLARALGKPIGPEQEAVLKCQDGRGAAFDDTQTVNERWRTMSVAQTLTVRFISGAVNQRLGHTAPSIRSVLLRNQGNPQTTQRTDCNPLNGRTERPLARKEQGYC